MSLLALASHILNFVAPAAAVALLVALGARAAMPAVARRGGWGAVAGAHPLLSTS